MNSCYSLIVLDLRQNVLQNVYTKQYIDLPTNIIINILFKFLECDKVLGISLGICQGYENSWRLHIIDQRVSKTALEPGVSTVEGLSSCLCCLGYTLR